MQRYCGMTQLCPVEKNETSEPALLDMLATDLCAVFLSAVQAGSATVSDFT